MKRLSEDANPTAVCKASKFNLALCAQPRKTMPFSPPKASELQKSASKQPKAQPLPQDIAVKLKGIDLIIAIDVETHDWETRYNLPGGPGQFGFYTIKHPDDFLARVVQIGWAIGGVSENEPQVKEYIIQPDGFEISDKAAKYHGICQTDANNTGKPLHEVLSEFVVDVRSAVAKGGRIVAHNLELGA